ncbi:hypothetical protein R3Q06_11205 [Rhodococcus erythropolis]|uniref:hypothetical protein n=1 Tax=Rhodococcus erythropolis TaxID=1833 RepID=UPI002949DCA1|nr:hypothetical protein [Rhodococcus erythropolis]MDV6274067.1 hypothetical protein [Rhodococcus erythropolis]
MSDIDSNVANMNRLLKVYKTFDAESHTAKVLDAEIDRLSDVIHSALEVETPDLVTQVAMQFAGSSWDGYNVEDQQFARDDAERALAYLVGAGRLIPSDGMALTAEQVELLSRVLGAIREFDGPASDLTAALALFPATEPAEDVQSWPTWGSVPDGVWFTKNGLGPVLAFRKRGEEIDHQYRNGSVAAYNAAIFNFFDEGPFVPAPAPAEPAEEETKAEEKLVAHRDSKGDIYVGHALVAFKHRSYEQIRRWFNEAHPGGISERRYRAVLHLLNVEASSPVVPAPAETGPWPSVDEIPESVTRIKDCEGDVWHRCTVGWEHGGIHGPEGYAPFVAAEEG